MLIALKRFVFIDILYCAMPFRYAVVWSTAACQIWQMNAARVVHEQRVKNNDGNYEYLFLKVVLRVHYQKICSSIS